MNRIGAYLTIDQFSLWLRSLNLHVHKEVDDLDLPIDEAYTTQLTLVFDSTRNPVILDWIHLPDERLSGSVTVIEPEGRAIRVINFNDAYCLAFQEEYNSGSAAPFVTTLTISPETISFGLRPNAANWPPLAFN